MGVWVYFVLNEYIIVCVCELARGKLAHGSICHMTDNRLSKAFASSVDYIHCGKRELEIQLSLRANVL